MCETFSIQNVEFSLIEEEEEEEKGDLEESKKYDQKLILEWINRTQQERLQQHDELDSSDEEPEFDEEAQDEFEAICESLLDNAEANFPQVYLSAIPFENTDNVQKILCKKVHSGTLIGIEFNSDVEGKFYLENRNRRLVEVNGDDWMSLSSRHKRPYNRKPSVYTEYYQFETSDGRYQCPKCEKILSSVGALHVHQRVHTGERHFQCSQCGKSFQSKGNLERHERSHSGVKPFQCDLCQQRFTEEKSLKVHMRRHTGERPYKCPYCDKAFNQSGVLQSHLHTHTGMRPYKCQYCDKTFSNKNQVFIHEKRHRGHDNSSKKCPHCDKMFHTNNELQRHILKHTDERPYICELCHKSFRRLQNLNEHINRHTGHTPYTCSQCGRGFPDLSSCSKHTKKCGRDGSVAGIIKLDESNLDLTSDMGGIIKIDSNNVIRHVVQQQNSNGETQYYMIITSVNPDGNLDLKQEDVKNLLQKMLSSNEQESNSDAQMLPQLIAIGNDQFKIAHPSDLSTLVLQDAGSNEEATLQLANGQISIIGTMQPIHLDGQDGTKVNQPLFAQAIDVDPFNASDAATGTTIKVMMPDQESWLQAPEQTTALDEHSLAGTSSSLLMYEQTTD